jgi:hypothetical protein
MSQPNKLHVRLSTRLLRPGVSERGAASKPGLSASQQDFMNVLNFAKSNINAAERAERQRLRQRSAEMAAKGSELVSVISYRTTVVPPDLSGTHQDNRAPSGAYDSETDGGFLCSRGPV